jgi:hypothetical protein
MKKIATAAAIATLLGASATANAWWGGPWNSYGDRSWMDDFFGDGMFDFNMNASARGSGYNRWYDRGYYGYGPYGYGYPYAAYAAPHAYPYAAAPVAPVAPAQGESK